jgi:hypothetical protein
MLDAVTLSRIQFARTMSVAGVPEIGLPNPEVRRLVRETNVRFGLRVQPIDATPFNLA